MELRMIDKKAKHLRLEVSRVDKGFLTVLQKELNSDSNVTEVGVNFGHPLLGRYELTVNTNGKVQPKDALIKALERMGKTSEKLNAAFQEIK